MATYVPAKRATEYIFYVGLVSQANTKILKTTPTIAAGDFKVSKDGGATADLTTLPTNTPASSSMVKITLSGTEMTADNVTIICTDVAGAEWCDLIINIQTATRQVDDLAYPATSGRSLAVDAAGLVDANEVKILGTAIFTPATAGILDVNVKNMNNVAASSITTIKAVQGIAVDGVITTLTNLPAITANWLTGNGINASALNGKGDWNIGKTGYSLSSPQSFNLIGNISGTFVGNQIGNIQGYVANVTGSVGGVTGLTPSLLDVAVSSRMASGTVVVGTNNDKTNYSLANNQVVNFSGTITNVFNVLNPVTAIQITGSVNVIGLNPAYLDTYVSSRMASGTVSVAGLNTSYIDTPISSRMASGTVVVAGLNTALLDVAVSSRMASGTVTVGTNNDKTGYGLSTGTLLSAIADAVWDEQIGGHLVTGSTGKSLSNASSAGDPWTTPIPGAYGAGTAGYIIGTNADVPISSRLSSGTFASNYVVPPTAAANATAVLSAATANPIDANVQEVNDVTIVGDGSVTPWGP